MYSIGQLQGKQPAYGSHRSCTSNLLCHSFIIHQQWIKSFPGLSSGSSSESSRSSHSGATWSWTSCISSPDLSFLTSSVDRCGYFPRGIFCGFKDPLISGCCLGGRVSLPEGPGREQGLWSPKELHSAAGSATDLLCDLLHLLTSLFPFPHFDNVVMTPPLQGPVSVG